MREESQNIPSSVHLELPSSFSELEAVVDQAEAFFSASVPDEELVYRIILLASEAVSNAMEHGNHLDETKHVIIDFLNLPDTLEIWVEDEGEGYDRAAVADPLATEHLFDDGGRGIFLIEELADEVLYEKGGRRIGIRFEKTTG